MILENLFNIFFIAVCSAACILGIKIVLQKKTTSWFLDYKFRLQKEIIKGNRARGIGIVFILGGILSPLAFLGIFPSAVYLLDICILIGLILVFYK